MMSLNNILDDDSCFEDSDKITARVLCELLSPKGSHGMGKLFLESFIRDVLKLKLECTELQEVYAGENNLIHIKANRFSICFNVSDVNNNYLDDVKDWVLHCMNIITSHDNEIPIGLYKTLSKFSDMIQNLEVMKSENASPELKSDLGEYLGEKILNAVKDQVRKFCDEKRIRNLDNYIQIGVSGFMYARADKNSMWKLCVLTHSGSLSRFKIEVPNFKCPNEALTKLCEESNFITFRDNCVRKILAHA